MSAIGDFYSRPTLNDGFGSTKSPRKNPHRGLDFPHRLGTPIPSLLGGVVVISEWSNGLGNIIEVKQDDGRYVGYRHTRSAAPRVKVGARVSRGDIVAQVSDTGTLAYGYHLCTTNSARQGGVYGIATVDPWPFIQSYVAGGAAPQPSVPAASHTTELTVPLSGSGWDFAPPTQDIQQRIQIAMAKRGRYQGKQNGKWGPLSVKGVQLTARNIGYSGPIDGAPGFNTCKYVQVYAKKFGNYKGPQDSKLGPNSWLGFCLGLEEGL